IPASCKLLRMSIAPNIAIKAAGKVKYTLRLSTSIPKSRPDEPGIGPNGWRTMSTEEAIPKTPPAPPRKKATADFGGRRGFWFDISINRRRAIRIRGHCLIKWIRYGRLCLPVDANFLTFKCENGNL